MKIMLSKALVFAVIVLFVGAGVVPSISSDGEPSFKVIKENGGNIGSCSFDTSTFYPTDDSYVSSTIPSENNGYRIDMSIRNGGSGNNWAAQPVIKFDISTIPSETDIVSASLNIFYRNYADNSPSGRELTLYRLKGDWNEETITWNNMPVHHNGITSLTYAPSSPSNWMQWDVTGDVQDFITGQTENYGWIIKDEQYCGSSGIPLMYCNSKEYGANIPYLEIETNEPPDTPTITGPTSGKAGNSYTYSASTTDPDGDNVYYLFDWDDGTDSGWKGPYMSGGTCNVSHIWGAQGTYSINVKAKDEYDAESDLATFAISMPKTKAINTPFLNFLEQHPYMFPLLRQLLGL